MQTQRKHTLNQTWSCYLWALATLVKRHTVKLSLGGWQNTATWLALHLAQIWAPENGWTCIHCQQRWGPKPLLWICSNARNLCKCKCILGVEEVSTEFHWELGDFTKIIGFRYHLLLDSPSTLHETKLHNSLGHLWPPRWLIGRTFVCRFWSTGHIFSIGKATFFPSFNRAVLQSSRPMNPMNPLILYHPLPLSQKGRLGIEHFSKSARKSQIHFRPILLTHSLSKTELEEAPTGTKWLLQCKESRKSTTCFNLTKSTCAFFLHFFANNLMILCHCLIFHLFVGPVHLASKPCLWH